MAECRKVIITMSDGDAVLLASNKNQRFLPPDRYKKLCEDWLQSFFRGLEKYDHLNLMITIKKDITPSYTDEWF